MDPVKLADLIGNFEDGKVYVLTGSALNRIKAAILRANPIPDGKTITARESSDGTILKAIGGDGGLNLDSLPVYDLDGITELRAGTPIETEISGIIKYFSLYRIDWCGASGPGSRYALMSEEELD